MTFKVLALVVELLYNFDMCIEFLIEKNT